MPQPSPGYCNIVTINNYDACDFRGITGGPDVLLVKLIYKQQSRICM